MYELPKELDNEAGLAKLETTGITIEKCTEEVRRQAKAAANVHNQS